MRAWLKRFAAWLYNLALTPEERDAVTATEGPKSSAMLIDEDRVTAAVREAYVEVGLPADFFRRTRKLTKSGKAHEILTLAADKLGVDHELTTVGDVIDWLREAGPRPPGAA